MAKALRELGGEENSRPKRCLKKKGGEGQTGYGTVYFLCLDIPEEIKRIFLFRGPIRRTPDMDIDLRNLFFY